MKEKKCQDYFESYIKHLMGNKIESKKFSLIKGHIRACSECQNRLFMFVDILDEYLLKGPSETAFSMNIIDLFFNDLYPSIVEASTKGLIKYLLLYKRCREKVIDILPFDSTEELYDFYENRLMPAFDEQNMIDTSSYVY